MIDAATRDRFWAKVNKSGGPEACWTWATATDKDGYGRFWFRGNSIAASRAAWILTKGEVPEGMEVLHNCPGKDNPSCCNPAHLWLGSKSDNMADRDRKENTARGNEHGRRLHPEAYEHLQGDGWYATHQQQSAGEDHWAAKLTWEKVRALRKEYLDGAKQSALASKFGIDQTTVSEIVLNKKWTEEGGNVRELVLERKRARDAAILVELLAGRARADVATEFKVSRQVIEDVLRAHRGT